MPTIKEVFEVFDKDRDGKIAIHELGLCLRALGNCPTEKEMLGLIKDADPQDSGKFDLKTFEKVAGTKGLRTVSKDELLSAFKAWDKEENGYINVAELRHALTSFGEPLKDNEAEMILTEAGATNEGLIMRVPDL